MSGYRTIPAAAVQAAGEALTRYMVGDDLECVPRGMAREFADTWIRAISDAADYAMPAVLTAALPHLLTDEMVARAADALWDQRVDEARAAIEAALGKPS